MSLARRTLLVAVIGGVLAAAPPAVAAPTPASTCFGQLVSPGMVGTDGENTINGTAGDDVIVAGDGNDTIDGRGGNDRICAGDGDPPDVRADDQFDDDIVRGGDGDDRINGGFGNDRIDGGSGNDPMLLGDDGEPTGFISTADKIDGGDGNDTLVGGGDQDILRGEAGADEIQSREGDDTAVIDVVIGGLDRDTCVADPKDDVSECEAGDGRNLSSDDDLFPNNSFGSAVSARRPGGSGPSSDGESSSGGSTSDQSASPSFFFSVFRGLYPRCLPQPPLVGKRGISAFRLGERTSRSLLRPLVPPLSSRRGRFVYCNEGGGQTYLLTSRGRVRLLATTAETKRTRGVAPGDRLSVLRRAYDDAERIGSGLYRGGSSSPVFFGVRAGKISFVAVSPRALLADPRDLARAVRQLRPGR